MNTVGSLVRAWRLDIGLTTRELAATVGGKVKRQHIEQLESGQVAFPRYLYRLARLMGYTGEELQQLKPPPLPHSLHLEEENTSSAAAESLQVTEPPGTYLVPSRSLLINAVETIAKLLLAMNGVQKAMASSALKHLADQPRDWAEVAEQLQHLQLETQKQSAA